MMKLLRRQQSQGVSLGINPVACDGIGMCAHLAAALIELDPWGFPLLPEGELSGPEQRAARRAAAGCPRRALFLEERS